MHYLVNIFLSYYHCYTNYIDVCMSAKALCGTNLPKVTNFTFLLLLGKCPVPFPLS